MLNVVDIRSLMGEMRLLMPRPRRQPALASARFKDGLGTPVEAFVERFALFS